MPTLPLTLRAGPAALRLIRDRGLRIEDVDIVPGASGGAKWLILGGLDHYLFTDFLQQPRHQPLHLIGSSIGSWRMACLAQRDPAAALARGHQGYIHGQDYTPKPSLEEVTRVLGRLIDELLGPTGVDEILAHPTFRLHVITAVGRGLAASTHTMALGAAMALAATGNAITRRTLAAQFERRVFHSAGQASPFTHLADLPTSHCALTKDTLRDALMASGSIPLLMEGIRIGSADGAMHWDGGVLDYHLDLDFGPGDGIVLYPHFYDHIVPGWFDKSLPWRRAGATNFRRTVLIAPSTEWVKRLPGGKIPDRRDFYRLSHVERHRVWQGVLDASMELGGVLKDLVTSGRIADVLVPW